MTRTKNEMQKQLEMDLKARLTESQYEVLKTLANASGDTPDEWLHSTVIGGLESDIDLYFGASKTIREKLFKMAGVKDG
jgi:hypothetical protein